MDISVDKLQFGKKFFSFLLVNKKEKNFKINKWPVYVNKTVTKVGIKKRVAIPAVYCSESQ